MRPYAEHHAAPLSPCQKLRAGPFFDGLRLSMICQRCSQLDSWPLIASSISSASRESISSGSKHRASSMARRTISIDLMSGAAIYLTTSEIAA